MNLPKLSDIIIKCPFKGALSQVTEAGFGPLCELRNRASRFPVPSRFPPSIYKPAARFLPTAKGGNEQGGARIFGPSQKYSHISLKPREEEQGIQDELPKQNLRKELEECERRHFASKAKSCTEDRDRRKGGQVLWKEQGEKLKIELFRVIMMLMILMHKSKMMQRVMAMMMMTRMIKALLAELERIKKEQAKQKLSKEQLQQAAALKDKEA
ncbi:unnamed protein product [Musa acuminata subsp. malaccensis]|uniref:(wild Malaysian banana) hypothetical protein n=1 Tax=Musa acuminata subsp. malaccensis TaxID=214687 RepID=A0A804HVK6_MUSAM|nr:unnamed protein product [Musa acuminata subsp. malaccensis]